MLVTDCTLTDYSVDIGVDFLISCAVKKEGAKIARNGALVVNAGCTRTGRSPNDRFIVKDSKTETTVNWGKVNKPFSPRQFHMLWDEVQLYLENNNYSSTVQIGASEAFGYNVKIRTERAWHHVFLKNLFIKNNTHNYNNTDSWELISAPGFVIDQNRFAVQSQAAVVLNITDKKY